MSNINIMESFLYTQVHKALKQDFRTGNFHCSIDIFSSIAKDTTSLVHFNQVNLKGLVPNRISINGRDREREMDNGENGKQRLPELDDGKLCVQSIDINFNNKIANSK